MNALTKEDLEINLSGTLTKDQLWQIKSKGIVNSVAACCFLAFIPIGFFAANLRSTTILIIWVVAASIFGSIFLWLAASYLRVKKDGHEIQQVSGPIEIKPSGNKNIFLKIGDRSFFMRKSEAGSMKNGQEYTVYFIEEPKMPLGYIRKE